MRESSGVIDLGPQITFSQQSEKSAGTAFGRPPQFVQPTTCGFFCARDQATQERESLSVVQLLLEFDA